ncbi:MAG: hypothetical protein GY769_01460 [bacterium]|nr:hypothetical protein [bacterium]
MTSKLTNFTLILALAGFTALVIAPTGVAAEDMDGKALFTETHKCNMCHAVPAADIEAKTTSEKMKGGDLGGKVEGELAEIAAYVRKEADMDGKQHKKPFKGTDEELQAIIDWLGSLEAQE